MSSLKALVDRGLEIVAQMDKLDKELKEIEAQIEAAGLKHPEQHEELKDADREGKRWPAAGTGKIVPVIFTADIIVGSFAALGPIHQKIRTSLGGQASMLGRFFKSVTKYENVFDDGKKFRTAAHGLLGDAAPPFITACVARDKHGIAKSSIKIEWKKAEAA